MTGPSATAEPPAVASFVTGSDAPFVLESRLRAHRVQHGQTIMLDEIRSGDIVMDGDRLQLSVRTSKDAYLYLAFCSQQAEDPRYRGLVVFPEYGAIRLVANQPTPAPARNAEIVLDNQPGLETLYLILSRSELSHADAGLADVIAAARVGRETADCGTAFRGALAGQRKANTVPRDWNGGQGVARASQRGPHGERKRDPNLAGKPVVEIERGGKVMFGGVQSGVEADSDGLVVLRYVLKHVPAAR